ncbi:MAG TPA: hypothetical protein VF043_07570 [Ktedonobacteraceae bacterium]
MRRVQPHGAAGLLEPAQQRLEARIVQRGAQDVGGELCAQRRRARARQGRRSRAAAGAPIGDGG